MSTVRTRVIEILVEQPEQEIEFNTLAKQLVRERVLGFGVEPIDVVNILLQEGKVVYDQETDIVKLLTDDEQLRFKLVLEKKSCQRALIELTSERDARMSVRMDAICRILERRVIEINDMLNEEK